MGTLVIGEKDCSYNALISCFKPSGALEKPYPSYSHLARNLKLSEDAIKTLERDLYYGSLLYEDAYRRALEIWKDNYGESASLDKLISKLRKCDYNQTADKLLEKFNISMDSLELDKIREANSHHYKQELILDHISTNILPLVNFTTVDDKLLNYLLEINIIPENIYNDWKSISHRKTKSVTFYNYILQNPPTVKDILMLIVELHEQNQHNAARTLAKPFLECHTTLLESKYAFGYYPNFLLKSFLLQRIHRSILNRILL